MDNETFIKVYDNAIPNLLCDKLIKKFGIKFNKPHIPFT